MRELELELLVVDWPTMPVFELRKLGADTILKLVRIVMAEVIPNTLMTYMQNLEHLEFPFPTKRAGII